MLDFLVDLGAFVVDFFEVLLENDFKPYTATLKRPKGLWLRVAIGTYP